MKRKILFLENDHLTRFLYKSMTDSRKFDYVVVNSREAAVDLLYTSHFDVIVADSKFGQIQLLDSQKTLIPSIMVSNGGFQEVKEIIRQQPNCDMIIRDKKGNFVYDLLDLIEISIAAPSPFREALDALQIHSN